MKKKVFFLFFPLFFVFAFPALAGYPSLTGFVNDFAGLFSSDFKLQLEEKLRGFEVQTTNEVVVVAIDSLEGKTIEDYAVGLFEKEKIGKKGKDNGVLFLIAKKEREVRIEVGYGLEPLLPDGRVGEIIRKVIVPNFQKENYEEGVLLAVEEIMAILKGEPLVNQDGMAKKEIFSENPSLLYGGIFLFYLLATYLASFLGRSKEIWPGGVIGGIFGAALGGFFGSFWLVFFGGVLGGGFGLLLDFLLSRNYQLRKKQGLSTDWWTSRGGFWSGGGWGRGGGFGGFGGGSSGGGGASSRW